MKRPLTCVNLIKAIGTLSAGQDPVRLSRAMANVIVAQMLPDGRAAVRYCSDMAVTDRAIRGTSTRLG